MEAAVLAYKGPAVLARAVLGAGLAGLLLVSGLLPEYALEWRALLPLLVLGASLWSLPAGYFLAVAAIGFPIWQLSPYLMALFIAAAIIPHRVALAHMPLTLLVAWAPVFAELRLDFAVLLLAGVLGGVRYGLAAGALSALWIKLYAAMSGNPLDLLLLDGAPGSFAAIAGRFAGAGSLETLQLIAFPFAPNAGELLVNLLQILACAGAGAAAGWLAGWGRSRLVLRDIEEAPPLWLYVVRRIAWSAVLPTLVPALALAVLLLLLPVAIARPLSELGLQHAAGSLIDRLVLGAGATLAFMALVLAAQPLPPLPRRAKPQRPAARPAAPKAQKPQLEPLPDLSSVRSGRFVPAWAASAGYSVAPVESDAAALPPEDHAAPYVRPVAFDHSYSSTPPAGPRDTQRRNEPEIAIEMD